MSAESSIDIWIVQDGEDGRILGVFDNQDAASRLAEERQGIYASYNIGFGTIQSSGDYQF